MWEVSSHFVEEHVRDLFREVQVDISQVWESLADHRQASFSDRSEAVDVEQIYFCGVATEFYHATLGLQVVTGKSEINKMRKSFFLLYVKPVLVFIS
jgi:hypothetical protein